MFQYIIGMNKHGHKTFAINGMPDHVHLFFGKRPSGGFSYSRSHIDRVVKYIRDQETHHRKKTFLMEYKEFLEKIRGGAR